METSSSAIKYTWEKDTNQKAQRPKKEGKKRKKKRFFLSEKMFNSFIETKNLKTKNNDKR